MRKLLLFVGMGGMGVNGNDGNRWELMGQMGEMGIMGTMGTMEGDGSMVHRPTSWRKMASRIHVAASLV